MYLFDYGWMLCRWLLFKIEWSNEIKCSFHRIPAVIKHQGEQMLAISKKRRQAWIWAISRADLTDEKLGNAFVYSPHCVQGKLLTA